MRIKFLLVCISLLCTLAVAAPPAPKAPKPLLAQVQRLTELLRDSYAVGYPNATMVQSIKFGTDDEVTLVVFTVEGWGGGNTHTQYLAAFTPETNENGIQHFSLIDVISVAGKGWRGIEKLRAKATRSPKSRDTTIIIDALEVTADDAPNFPSKKTTINILLKDGRLTEQKGP